FSFWIPIRIRPHHSFFPSDEVALSFLKKIVAWYGNPKQRISSKEGDKAVYMTRLRLLRRRIGQAVLMRAFGSADKAISKLLDRAGFTKRARASMAFL
ncbi:hypothetical protein ADUPG1_013822, partial [Aduncisulcus paluster]